MSRFKLRTLLIVLALGPALIAWIATSSRVEWKHRLRDGNQVIFRVSRFSLSKRRFDDGANGAWAVGQLGNQCVIVNPSVVWQDGGRGEHLPASWD